MTKQMNSFTFRTSSRRYVGMTLRGVLSVQRQSFQSPHPSLGFRSFPPIFHQGSKDCSDCFRQFLWQDWVLLFIDSPWFRKLMAFMHAYSSLLTFNWLNLRKRQINRSITSIPSSLNLEDRDHTRTPSGHSPHKTGKKLIKITSEILKFRNGIQKIFVKTASSLLGLLSWSRSKCFSSSSACSDGD